MSKISSSVSQPYNPQTPQKAASIPSKTTPLVGKVTSHTTKTHSSDKNWRVDFGFRAVLKRELEGAILEGPSLHLDVFPDGIILSTLGRTLLELVSATDGLRTEGRWKGFPNGHQNREHQWASFLNTIINTVAKSTGHQPRRSWSTRFATSPVQGEHSKRKPDLVLAPTALKTLETWAHVESFAEEKSAARFAKGSSGLDMQVADRAYFMFSRQPNRRFILGVSIAGSFLRLSMFDRAGVVHGPFIDVANPAEHADFLRIVLGLAFCEPTIIGYDPTVTTVDDVTYVFAGQKRYRVLDTLFISDVIRGRGTIVRKATLDSDADPRLFVIKDVWADIARPHSEDHFLAKAQSHGVENIPYLVSGEDVQSHYNLKSTRFHFRNPPHASTPPSGQENLEERVHRRYVMEGCGTPITQFRDKRELLQTMADLLKIHKNLVDAGILHRDISIRNLMFWHGHVPQAQMGSTARRGFIIDFDYAAMISEHNTQTTSVAHRTGTIPFMACDILMGDEDHAPKHDIESFFYVLIFLCLEYDGPGRERVWNHKDNKKWDVYETPLRAWIEGPDLGQIGSSKALTVGRKKPFSQTVLGLLPPYFQDLSECLEEIRLKVINRQFDGEDVTHESVISILEDWAAKPLDEVVPPSQPNVCESVTLEPETIGNRSLKRSRRSFDARARHVGLDGTAPKTEGAPSSPTRPSDFRPSSESIPPEPFGATPVKRQRRSGTRASDT